MLLHAGKQDHHKAFQDEDRGRKEPHAKSTGHRLAERVAVRHISLRMCARADLQSWRVARLRLTLPKLARAKGCSWALDAPGRLLPDCQCWGSASRTTCTCARHFQASACTAKFPGPDCEPLCAWMLSTPTATGTLSGADDFHAPTSRTSSLSCSSHQDHQGYNVLWFKHQYPGMELSRP